MVEGGSTKLGGRPRKKSGSKKSGKTSDKSSSGTTRKGWARMRHKVASVLKKRGTLDKVNVTGLTKEKAQSILSRSTGEMSARPKKTTSKRKTRKGTGKKAGKKSGKGKSKKTGKSKSKSKK